MKIANMIRSKDIIVLNDESSKTIAVSAPSYGNISDLISPPILHRNPVIEELILNPPIEQGSHGFTLIVRNDMYLLVRNSSISEAASLLSASHNVDAKYKITSSMYSMQSADSEILVTITIAPKTKDD